MVELLLQNGADINHQNEGKRTPLHFTALEGIFISKWKRILYPPVDEIHIHIFMEIVLFCSGHEKAAEVLLKNGINCCLLDDKDTEPIHYAALFGKFSIK